MHAACGRSTQKTRLATLRILALSSMHTAGRLACQLATDDSFISNTRWPSNARVSCTSTSDQCGVQHMAWQDIELHLTMCSLKISYCKIQTV